MRWCGATPQPATWVAFKVWGIMSLIFLFALAQTPFLLKHHVNPGTADESSLSGISRPQ